MLAVLKADDDVLARADDVHRLSGGNPLFIRELARGAAGDLPTSIRETVVTRFAGLSPEGQRTVGAVAVAGRAVGHRLLAEALDLVVITRGVPDAVRSGLLLVEGESYRISHELVRVSIVDDLMPAERLVHHAALARSLARTAPIPFDAATSGEIAWHFEQSGHAVETARWARRSAEEAERIGAFAAAHAQLVRLLAAEESLGTLAADERVTLLSARPLRPSARVIIRSPWSTWMWPWPWSMHR